MILGRILKLPLVGEDYDQDNKKFLFQLRSEKKGLPQRLKDTK